MAKSSGDIKVGAIREHRKASERYVDVQYRYPDEGGHVWEGSVPIEYRWTGVSAKTDAAVTELIDAAYEAMRPSHAIEWLQDQEVFWNGMSATVTRPFFDALKDSEWKCRDCDLPNNPNFARRIQALKEMGYTLATNTSRLCLKCKNKTTHHLLLRLPRGAAISYETWSPKLRKRIESVLDNYDVYEGATRSHLLPDHKFPEVRWDASTSEDNPEDMTDAQIRHKFQLLSNQRNQQKREVCRNCFQTRQRGNPFGIPFYYEGGATWPEQTPSTGKEAEKGCVGCGWYDMAEWRRQLVKKLPKR